MKNKVTFAICFFTLPKSFLPFTPRAISAIYSPSCLLPSQQVPRDSTINSCLLPTAFCPSGVYPDPCDTPLNLEWLRRVGLPMVVLSKFHFTDLGVRTQYNQFWGFSFQVFIFYWLEHVIIIFVVRWPLGSTKTFFRPKLLQPFWHKTLGQCWCAGAVVTTFHRLKWFQQQKIISSTVVEPGSQRSRYWQAWFLLRPLSLTYSWTPSGYILTDLSSVPLYPWCCFVCSNLLFL
jgi:hypothetical protein